MWGPLWLQHDLHGVSKYAHFCFDKFLAAAERPDRKATY
jgi:hypothetical protein